jgi:hypothetical protein
MIKETYTEYTELGIKVIPIEWDTTNKQPVSHRNWSNPDDLTLRPSDNGLMILTGNNYGCLDFDLKNTKDKDIFNKWMAMVTNEAPEILNNLFIEQTRNGGYHVWMYYKHLPKKQQLAANPEGNEVIALYCNGPVVYTYPTPGYTEFHQSMADLKELTVEQYNYLIEVSQYFNQYKPDFDPTKKAINYPKGYEKQLSDYDKNINEDSFEAILNTIGLHPISDYHYRKADKFRAYRRQGSASVGISAKVYHTAKRVLIFSASMHNFPNWHNKEEYPEWSLPASFMLFYHLGRDWDKVLAHIGIVKDENAYPYDIFPQAVQKSLFEVANEKSLHPEFLATAGLWTIASLAGNCFTSDLPDETKNILFALMIAPVSVGKTPAFKAMCETPLKDLLAREDKDYEEEVKNWNLQRADANANKQPFNKPHPKRFHPFAVDGTTEGYIGLMQDQQGGMGVYHDEAETILNAGAHKANNDAISFFTQAFSGGRYTQIRADRSKERVVKSLNISLLMGTQPSRLKNLFGADRIQSGFASRFLMVQSDYIKLQEEVDPFTPTRAMCQEWSDIIFELYKHNKEFSKGDNPPRKIIVTDEAKPILTKYYRQQRKDANDRKANSVEDYVMGTEAKMSAYYFRFCHIIAIMQNPMVPLITTKVAHQAWQLYRWYAESTMHILGSIYEENESGLPTDLRLLVDNLPAKFTTKEAEAICVRLNIKPVRFKNAMRRQDFAKNFKRVSHGVYEKM